MNTTLNLTRPNKAHNLIIITGTCHCYNITHSQFLIVVVFFFPINNNKHSLLEKTGKPFFLFLCRERQFSLRKKKIPILSQKKLKKGNKEFNNHPIYTCSSRRCLVNNINHHLISLQTKIKFHNFQCLKNFEPCIR